MLYDPKWEQQTKADPLTLDSLIAWLEKQPADKTYCYMDSGRCLAAQYNASIGRDYLVATYSQRYERPFDWVLEEIAVDRPYTFGAALTRARAEINK